MSKRSRAEDAEDGSCAPEKKIPKVEDGKLILTGPKGSKEIGINDKIFAITYAETQWASDPASGRQRHFSGLRGIQITFKSYLVKTTDLISRVFYFTWDLAVGCTACRQ